MRRRERRGEREKRERTVDPDQKGFLLTFILTCVIFVCVFVFVFIYFILPKRNLFSESMNEIFKIYFVSHKIFR